MRYYLDCEFDGFGGKILSMALVREDNESLYMVFENNLQNLSDPWVEKNIIPIIWSIPSPFPGRVEKVTNETAPFILANYFSQDSGQKHVVSDWPDDIKYLCESLITGPGTMSPVDNLYMSFHRIDAYPTYLAGAVRHNAFWDAKALQVRIS